MFWFWKCRRILCLKSWMNPTSIYRSWMTNTSFFFFFSLASHDSISFGYKVRHHNILVNLFIYHRLSSGLLESIIFSECSLLCMFFADRNVPAVGQDEEASVRQCGYFQQRQTDGHWGCVDLALPWTRLHCKCPSAEVLLFLLLWLCNWDSLYKLLQVTN